MSANKYKRHTITAALPYANGPLHIGHLAGAYLSSDAYARYLRLLGKEVAFICGSDEHGAAITIRAKKDGTTPKEIVDKYHEIIQNTFKELGVSFDHYSRTSNDLHHKTAQDFFRVLNENGEFVQQVNEQYYDEENDQFLADRYIKGTCPKCSHEDAYGDQCEKCGSSLSPTDLINPKSTISGNTPVLKQTSHWFLSLEKHSDWLQKWIDSGELDGKTQHNPKEWKNHVLGQCRSWIGDLQPRAMTRDLDWGVDVPPEIEGAEGKKLYVWLDAPIGYISATKEWAGDDWEKWWKDEESQLVHFIGKDNIVFHCIIFPAILKAHGGYLLPDNVPANQFLNLEGEKMSTSRNWAVWAHEYLEDLKEVNNHVDSLRYYLFKIMPEQRDSDFTWKGFQDAHDTDLVGKLANFVNRVVVLSNKNYDGVVPEIDATHTFATLEEDSQYNYAELLNQIKDALLKYGKSIEAYDFRGALGELIDISNLGNKLLQFNAPWSLQKTNPELVQTILNGALQVVAALSVAAQPFLPNTAAGIRSLLGLPALENGDLAKVLSALEAGTPLVKAGHKIEKPCHLFTRIDNKLIDSQLEKLKNSTANSEQNFEAVKDTISYEDFVKLDIRTGTIVEAEKVKKADKLLKITVDLGFEKRRVVSGIAKYYKPEDIIGTQVLVLVNLAPRKLRGIESEGMILMAENEEGTLAFVSPEEGFGNGWTVS